MTGNEGKVPPQVPQVLVEDVETGASGQVLSDDDAQALADAQAAKDKYVRFSKESFRRQNEWMEEEAQKARDRENNTQEGRLVDGVLVFGDGEDDDEEKMDFDPFLQEGCNLPEDYPEFPKNLFGVPIQEIDKHIMDTVSGMHIPFDLDLPAVCVRSHMFCACRVSW